MKTEHFNELKTLIDKEIKRIGDNALFAGYESVKQDPRVHSPRKRFVWDVFYCIPQLPRHDIMQRLYDYLHDEHIETALNKIVPDMGVL